MTTEQLEEERDDAVIGKALKWSAGALAGIAVIAIVGFSVWYWRPRTVEHKSAPVVAAAPRERVAAEVPQLPFKDITKEAGIDFRHENGAAGEKLLPETMGGGCAFLDYDTDGDQDILLVNSTRWAWDERPPSERPATMALYQNDGKGGFTDVTADAGLAVTFYGQGAAVGDYDNDGDPDLFFSAVGPNRLYRNDDGRFVDVTEAARVAGGPLNSPTAGTDPFTGEALPDGKPIPKGATEQWSTSCGWFDYDRDGDLDLFVCNYVQWSREVDISLDFQLTGGGRAYGRPQNFAGTFPYLYRNDGGGVFVEVGESAGLHAKNVATQVPVGKSLGVVFADFDADGWLDVAVANDTVQNFLFHNKQDGSFEEIAVLAGIAYDNTLGEARGAMGIDAARFRNSDEIGIAIGNFANEMSALYVAPDNSLQFTDEAVSTGFGPQTRLELTFGTVFCDVDLDGRVDIISANGHLEEDINKVQPSQFYEQPPHFFWNCGPEEPTEFVPVPPEKAGGDFYRRMVGRGAAFADIDGDGDLDLLFAASGQSPRLLRNDQSLGHHWLRVQLEGSRANRDAIGAQLELQLPDRRLFGQVMPTRSYLSQCEKIVTFGLGKTDRIEQLTIRWPNGEVQTVKPVAPDQVLKIRQSASTGGE